MRTCGAPEAGGAPLGALSDRPADQYHFADVSNMMPFCRGQRYDGIYCTDRLTYRAGGGGWQNLTRYRLVGDGRAHNKKGGTESGGEHKKTAETHSKGARFFTYFVCYTT